MNSHEIKLVVIGDSGVGKTSLVQRFVCDFFDSTATSTLGASFLTKTMEIPETDHLITFQIWDTAGQEKYRALTSLYYRDASAAILVCDVTNKKSFKSWEEWMVNLREYAPRDIVLYFAANKSDMLGQEAVDAHEINKFAMEEKADWKFTSAKEGSGIQEIFMNLCMKVFPKIQVERELKPQREDRKKLKSDNQIAKKKKKLTCCK